MTRRPLDNIGSGHPVFIRVQQRDHVATVACLVTDGHKAYALTNRHVTGGASARRIAQAYESWGKGAHPAALNFGDCFAYEVAKEHGCRLLDVGEDFRKTDVESAL